MHDDNGPSRTIVALLFCIVAPLLVLVIVRELPPSLLSTAKDFQTLIGGSIALGAAIVAYVNISRQIAAQNAVEAARLRAERDQMASALIGEIKGLIDVSERRNIAGYYRDNADTIRRTRQVAFWAIALGTDYMTIYRTMGHEIGRLRGSLPQAVVEVYGRFTGVFDRIKAAESGIYNGLAPDDAAGIADLIAAEVTEAASGAGTVLQLLERERTTSK